MTKLGAAEPRSLTIVLTVPDGLMRPVIRL